MPAWVRAKAGVLNERAACTSFRALDVSVCSFVEAVMHWRTTWLLVPELLLLVCGTALCTVSVLCGATGSSLALSSTLLMGDRSA